MPTLLLATFVACLALSFFMSGMEAGVFALSRLRVRHLMRSGRRSAAVLHGYLERPENFLWTILLGNMLANLGAVSLGVIWLHGRLWQHPWWMLGALAAGVAMFYCAFELLPKMLFRQFPNRLCLALAIPFGLVHGAMRPLVAPVAWLSRLFLLWTEGNRFTGDLFGNRDELRLVMQESAQSLSSEERVMINRVLDLQNATVRHVTVPLAKTVTVDESTPLRDLFALARERALSRFPVWKTEGARRRIAGIVSLRSILYEEHPDENRPARDLLQSALYLDEGTRIEVALRQMQRTGQRLAIVLGRDRQELGIVTLLDILRAIFGEVRL